jgi:hypothetical protein
MGCQDFRIWEMSKIEKKAKWDPENTDTRWLTQKSALTLISEHIQVTIVFTLWSFVHLTF